ncbi:MAG: class I SAM-dependent methyltransferase [Planctomycetota bacterium]|jgi:ubiquinone/menaquinone biosynthesis C-methylase UbiE
MSTTALDTERAETFAQRMLDTLNGASLAMMLSIGHRTGLFDAMAKTGRGTIEQIAKASDLNERYVREWLGAMTTGRIVEHDSKSGTYSLPAEHAACLTRDAGSDNLAQTMQWISVMGGVEDEVADAFLHGKGVPYSAFKRFHEVMADESALTVVAALIDHILPLEAGLIERLEKGIDVLDVGCGAGRAMNHLAEHFLNSRFVGYDFSEEAISMANAEAKAAGLTNVRFAVQDAATFTDTDAFDLVCTFDSVHDQAKPDAMLACIHRALRPGGLYLMQDIQGSSSHHGDMDHPIAPFIYTISCMHCMSVSLAHGGMGLGAAWGKETALKMLAEAGFKDVRVEELEHDFINYYYLSR